jgi:hypothetical protein
MNNMTFPQLLMMLNPGAANTTYLQPDQEAMLRNQSISPYTPEGNVQMPNMQALNIEGLLGSILGTGEGDAPINFGVDGLGPALSGYKGGLSNRGVTSQREMDTLMQILQTGR